MTAYIAITFKEKYAFTKIHTNISYLYSKTLNIIISLQFTNHHQVITISCTHLISTYLNKHALSPSLYNLNHRFSLSNISAPVFQCNHMIIKLSRRVKERTGDYSIYIRVPLRSKSSS